MASFSTLSAQQETNKKILEDLQQKKLLLQKGVPPAVANIAAATTLTTTAPTPLEVSAISGSSVNNSAPSAATSSSGTLTGPSAVLRSAFNPTASSGSFGFFIQQDSYYGNTFIPVLPRLEPTAPGHTPK